MNAMTMSKTIQWIEIKLAPMIRSGKRIEHLYLFVSPKSQMAQIQSIKTRFGHLAVIPGENIDKGFSYIREKPLSRGGIGFTWVSKRNPP